MKALFAFLFFALVNGFEEWKNPDGGNTYVTIGSKSIKWGTTKPWEALDKLKECTDLGCNGDKVLEVDTDLVSDDGRNPAKIKISAEGSLDPTSPTAKLENMVELIKKVAEKGPKEVKNEAYHAVGTCGGGAGGAFGTVCDRKEYHVDSYYQTEIINVRVEEDGKTSNMNVYIKVELDDTGADMCENIAKIAGSIAGAFSGVAGGAFGLAEVFCK